MTKLSFGAVAAECDDVLFGGRGYGEGIATNDFVYDDRCRDERPTVTNMGVLTSVGGYTYFTVTKCNLGFREAARLVQIAADSGSRIKLVAGAKVGTSDSVLSFIKMGVTAGSSVGISIVADEGNTLDAQSAKCVFAECRAALVGQ